ncbi:unnamed protein product [Rangifer tarandus platyrhynchus]|uniref:Uncharacterized protein n=1 Tax=Rangifer tarandus platyrhynchus TaxID=3082113 RepID=A0ABN8YFQ7_RANTA|nr:unnamed protein product [Rangifer tarandus platyrhynchus]
MAAGPATATLRAQARPPIAQSGRASFAAAAPFLLIHGAQGPAPGLARRRGGSWRSWPKGAVRSPPDPSSRGAAAHCRVRPRRRQVAGGRGLESGRRPRARWFCCCCEEGPGPLKPENAGRKCVTGGLPGHGALQVLSAPPAARRGWLPTPWAKFLVSRKPLGCVEPSMADHALRPASPAALGP